MFASFWMRHTGTRTARCTRWLRPPGFGLANSLAWIDSAAADRVADAVDHLSERVAVPSVGLLISPTPNGSLLVTRRAGGPLRPRRGGLPAAGQLRWYCVYYRDPYVLGGCPAASTFNITQTQEITWTP